MLEILNFGRKPAGVAQRRGLEGRIAVITGSGRGIGAAIATALAAEGVKVVVSSDDMDECHRVAEGITKSGGEAASVPCDVTDEGQVKSLLDKAAARYGSVDIMVNNAGIDEMGSVITTEPELWHKVLSVNLDGVFFGTKYAALKMKGRNWGRIINVSSVAGLRGFDKRAAYCASKAGVVGLTKAAAVDLGRYGITVNAICPGVTKTRMTEAFISNRGALDAFMRRMPIKRVGFPHEIAHAALFLAGKDAGYITGQTIVVDGGWSTQV
jgi:NAD(P)-dependent dehydrogenase (short-subunit alcohol dehydrogenase family)